ncbi:hypothetical protein PtA15_10A449 [Puccinia triticina]|uniref:Cyanovirin-N domain-containing protein n=1 Tax=Puccinia triticina TaxID=208348 RepID=A0ABY7CUW0_9BASI|nr:uncharacterized protein PtA15_10A449 [Puccinia triticina]WAQ89026.1 hypothetical protein PtA15_10A449 [Puccinia triticina]WAR59085.1 hypothetical protein PtB15_10B427 [Puccinia triticina]
MVSFKLAELVFSVAILGRLVAMIGGQTKPNIPQNVGPPPTAPVRHATVDIQCGNNYGTYPMGKGWVSCTNYGAMQYRCKEDTCYVGLDRKKCKSLSLSNIPLQESKTDLVAASLANRAVASKELFFYDCQRLGIVELLPQILVVRYKAANLAGAIEIMDSDGQEYSCRWTKPTDPANVRVSCSYCEERQFLLPTPPRRSEL